MPFVEIKLKKGRTEIMGTSYRNMIDMSKDDDTKKSNDEKDLKIELIEYCCVKFCLFSPS